MASDSMAHRCDKRRVRIEMKFSSRTSSSCLERRLRVPGSSMERKGFSSAGGYSLPHAWDRGGGGGTWFPPLVRGSLSPDPQLPRRVRRSRLPPALKSRNSARQRPGTSGARRWPCFPGQLEGKEPVVTAPPRKEMLSPAGLLPRAEPVVWGLEKQEPAQGELQSGGW